MSSPRLARVVVYCFNPSCKAEFTRASLPEDEAFPGSSLYCCKECAPAEMRTRTTPRVLTEEEAEARQRSNDKRFVRENFVAFRHKAAVRGVTISMQAYYPTGKYEHYPALPQSESTRPASGNISSAERGAALVALITDFIGSRTMGLLPLPSDGLTSQGPPFTTAESATSSSPENASVDAEAPAEAPAEVPAESSSPAAVASEVAPSMSDVGPRIKLAIGRLLTSSRKSVAKLSASVEKLSKASSSLSTAASTARTPLKWPSAQRRYARALRGISELVTPRNHGKIGSVSTHINGLSIRLQQFAKWKTRLAPEHGKGARGISEAAALLEGDALVRDAERLLTPFIRSAAELIASLDDSKPWQLKRRGGEDSASDSADEEAGFKRTSAKSRKRKKTVKVALAKVRAQELADTVAHNCTLLRTELSLSGEKAPLAIRAVLPGKRTASLSDDNVRSRKRLRANTPTAVSPLKAIDFSSADEREGDTDSSSQ